ncbi:MAG: GNAT family N-acetyltransferase [Pirellula sp.]|nr:GNAT family N-acetyltransferase [Pirellula sp.]
MQWYENWEDCIHACHALLPMPSRIAMIERLRAHVNRSTYSRPILAARSAGGSSGYIVLHPGALAIIGGLDFPDCESNACRADTAMLLEDLVECASPEVEIVQAVITQGELSAAEQSAYEECFRSAGLDDVAELVQVELNSPKVSSSIPLDCNNSSTIQLGDGLTLRDANEYESKEFAKIVEQTYNASLDVPELNGIRSTHNTIEGYASCVQESYLPWWVIEHQQESVGCLLLCPHQNELVELVYLGLVSLARGKGLGVRVLDFVSHWAAVRGATRVVAAVDQRNKHALQIYEKAGYTEFSRANAWIKAS